MSLILECPACGFSNAYLQGVGMGNWSGYQNLLNFFSTSKRGRMNRKAPIEQVESAAFHLATYKCARCNCPNQRMNYEVHLKNGQIIFPNFSCSYCRGKELIEIENYHYEFPKLSDVATKPTLDIHQFMETLEEKQKNLSEFSILNDYNLEKIPSLNGQNISLDSVS